MAQIHIPCLIGKTNMGGITSWYWQPSATLAKAGWKPLALGKDANAAFIAAQKRNEEVEAWKAGGALPQIKPKVRGGTFAKLLADYRRDVVLGTDTATGRRKIKDSTAGTYEVALKRLEAWAGQHPVGYITPARITALRNATARPIVAGGIGHSAAFNLLKTLRQVMQYAVRNDVIAHNPALRFDLGAPPSRAQVWEADDEAAFIAAANDLGLPSMALAIELAIYTAQREGDLIAATEAQLVELEIHDIAARDRLAGKDGKVLGWRVAQAKSSDLYASTWMEIPLEPLIREKVERAVRHNRAKDRAATPARLLTHVLVDDRTGLPWKRRAFVSAYRAIINHAIKSTGRAHMESLVWHDLRRSRVVRLRRRGFIPSAIASITGHSPASINMMLKVYGPIDPTITASTIASTLEALPTKAKPRTRKAKA